jgi:PPOX class probable F420-dependent enzyme
VLPPSEASGLPSGWKRDLLDSQRVARLGILDTDGRPRVLPVTYALHADRIWTAIDSKPKREDVEPARLRYLRRRPQVALTADRYDDDWARLAWVQVLGTASIRDVGDEPGALGALAEKYPQYRADRPPGPLIAITPERVVAWRAWQPGG